MTHGTRLSINIERELLYARTTSDFRVTCYGNIYNLEEIEQFDFTDLKREALVALLNRLAGFFCIVHQDLRSNVVTLANDSFGNFRLYLYDGQNQTYVSDNWETVVEQIKQDHGGLERVAEEEYYFHRHRYTTGGHTFIRHLDKLMPASLCTADSTGLTREIYLPGSAEKIDNDMEYQTRNHDLIARNISQGINPKYRNILFFSGGVDSTFLACAMMNLGLEFTPLFVRFDPPNSDNIVDGHKAGAVADHLGLKLETVDAPIASNMALIDKIVRRHPFDKAMLVPLELACENLSRRFGPCNIINGQASDSIYCWGASGKTLGCLIQRYLTSDLFTNRSGLVRAVVTKAVELIYRARWKTAVSFRVPHSDSDYWLGLLDPQGYVPVVHTGAEHGQYEEYLKRIVANIAGSLGGDHAAIRMYMKLMYLQGPANFYWVEAARTYGHQLVMPFLDAGIIGLKRKYQDDWHDLFHPRYVLEQTLSERFGFDVAVIDRCRRAPVDSKAINEFATLQKDIYKRWDRISAGLF